MIYKIFRFRKTEQGRGVLLHSAKIWLLLCLLSFIGLHAQNASPSRSTSDIDTTRLFSDKPLKSPMGATLRSAVLPGWGQLYNEKPVKSIFVAALNGYLIYQIVDNNRKYERTGNTTFRDRRGTNSWYFGLTYLLTLVDAYVDAYLFGFEKTMDIGIGTPQNGENQLQLMFRWQF